VFRARIGAAFHCIRDIWTSDCSGINRISKAHRTNDELFPNPEIVRRRPHGMVRLVNPLRGDARIGFGWRITPGVFESRWNPDIWIVPRKLQNWVPTLRPSAGRATGRPEESQRSRNLVCATPSHSRSSQYPRWRSGQGSRTAPGAPAQVRRQCRLSDRRH